MLAALICNALHMAIQVRRPAAGLVARSDCGSEYASVKSQALLAEQDGMTGQTQLKNTLSQRCSRILDRPAQGFPTPHELLSPGS